jgi:hypothetical protein
MGLVWLMYTYLQFHGVGKVEDYDMKACRKKRLLVLPTAITHGQEESSQAEGIMGKLSHHRLV